jgi:uncharacterized protein YyaL (SSP411 family)
VLQRTAPGVLSETIETALANLFHIRYGTGFADPDSVFPPARDNREAKTTAWTGRIPPVTDTKMIVAWNSLMISGLARAAAVFQKPEYLQLANRAADFIVNHQWVNDRFHRVNYSGKASVLAQSEDYALFIKALLDLQQAQLATSPSPANSQNLLDRAIQLQSEFDDFLWSIESGGYFNTDAATDLLLRERSYVDNATPAANGIAVANLVRLALLTEDLSYLDKAEKTLQAFGTVMQRSPSACPSLFSALDWWQNHTLVRTSAEQIPALATQNLPTVVWQLEELPVGAIALVCQGLSCQEPARSLEQLQTQLQHSQVRVS